MSASEKQHTICPGVVAMDPRPLTAMEFSRAIRRLGMSTRDVTNAFDTFRDVVTAWELGIETVPPAVAAALREWIDEQDQHVERQVARLSGIAEPEFLICRGGMAGHPFGWWHYVARQVALGVGKVLIVHIE